MKQCVVQVQSQHHLDVIIGRVRSLGGKYVHYGYTSVPSKTMYTVYQAWLRSGLPVYVWINARLGLDAYMHNHNCGCKVFQTVQDAIEYLGLDSN